MTWQEKAKRIPAWEGMRTARGDLVVCEYMPGHFTITDSGASYRDEDLTPDLPHGPTAREACAQLALFLGAPKDAVADGVQFHYSPLEGHWILQAGGGQVWDWDHVFSDIQTTNRPLAIATAWCWALDMMECEG